MYNFILSLSRHKSLLISTCHIWHFAGSLNRSRTQIRIHCYTCIITYWSMYGHRWRKKKMIDEFRSHGNSFKTSSCAWATSRHKMLWESRKMSHSINLLVSLIFDYLYEITAESNKIAMVMKRNKYYYNDLPS